MEMKECIIFTCPFTVALNTQLFMAEGVKWESVNFVGFRSCISSHLTLPMIKLHWIEKVYRSEYAFLNVSDLERLAEWKSIWNHFYHQFIFSVRKNSIDSLASASPLWDFSSFLCFILLQREYLRLLIERWEDVVNFL